MTPPPSPDRPRAARPRPRWRTAARTHVRRLGPLLWPLGPALACAAVLLALRWRWQHGGRYDQRADLWWSMAFGFVVTGWAYMLAAAALLRLTPLRRRHRLALATAFPVALYGGLSLTPRTGSFLQLNLADVFFVFPAAVISDVVPDPTYASPCAVGYWALGSRGYGADVRRLVELGDGGVLVAADAGPSDVTRDAPDGPKLARVRPDGRPDTAFALDRGCVPGAAAAVAGPGGTFTYDWRAPPADSAPGRVTLRLPWRDAAGRPVAGPRFPVPPDAIPPWADSQPVRLTPEGGLTLVGEIPAGRGDSVGTYGVARVLPDGRYDPRFAPWPIPPVDSTRCLAAQARHGRDTAQAAREAVWDACPSALSYRFLPAAVRDLPGGALLVRLHRAVDDSGRLLRLGPDGRPDDGFARRAAAALAPFFAPTAVAVDGAGRVLVGVRPRTPDFDALNRQVSAPDPRRLVRLLADGRPDSSFRADSAYAAEFGTVRALFAQPDGHVVADWGEWQQLPYGRPRWRLLRLDAAGRADTAFIRRVAEAADGDLGRVLVRRDGSVVAVASTGVLVLAPDGRPRGASPAR